MIERLTRGPLRWAATIFVKLRRKLGRADHAPALGVHAAVITPAGAVVLVRLRYARGWRLPGGGRSEKEDARRAMLRELHEEIGLILHGPVEWVVLPDTEADQGALFIVRDAIYRPRWSLEVEAVTEAKLDSLPEDLSERTRRWLDLVRPLVGPKR